MKVNGKDYPVYYGKKNVPNYQPVIYSYKSIFNPYSSGLKHPFSTRLSTGWLRTGFPVLGLLQSSIYKG